MARRNRSRRRRSKRRNRRKTSAPVVQKLKDESATITTKKTTSNKPVSAASSREIDIRRVSRHDGSPIFYYLLVFCLGGAALFAFGWVIVWACQARPISFMQIPSPRPHGWTIDLTDKLSPDVIQALNKLGDEVKQQKQAEIAIVVIHKMRGMDPRAYATNLFNHWGIGSAKYNNGILVFAALMDRKAEIILGDGVDSHQEVHMAEEIMLGEMVPKFKSGQPAAAVLHGARACAERILKVELPELPHDVIPSGGQNSASDGSKWISPIIFGGVFGSLVYGYALFLYAIFRRRQSNAYFTAGREEFLVVGSCLIGILSAIVVCYVLVYFRGYSIYGAVAGGGISVLAIGAVLRKYLRLRPCYCEHCKLAMDLLSEVADDSHLKKTEKTEERIGSVDYDVWQCAGCQSVQKRRFRALFSRYSRCPKCDAITKSSTSTTLRYATYTQRGLVRVDEECENCAYRSSHTYTTPMKTRSSSSSSSSSYSSSSGFGGGSSSGRGASGSW